MNNSFIEKVKAGSRKAFINIGNNAVGNPPDGKAKRGFIEPMPFSWAWAWLYEKPMPKRKSK